MTLIDLFLHLSWQLLDTAFPKQKKNNVNNHSPGVLCQVDFKIKITDQWSENLNIPEFGMTLQKPMNNFIDDVIPPSTQGQSTA